MADTTSRKSVLGKDFHITGELTIHDDAVIEGQVDGVIRGAGMIELSETARVSGAIIAGQVRISGQAQADVVGEEDVELMPGAKMRGRVFSHRFCVNEGAGFRGEIWVDADAMQAAKTHVLSQLGAAPAPAPGVAAAPAPAASGNGARADAGDVSSAELALLSGNGNGNGEAHGRPLRMRSGISGVTGNGNGR
ncbi:MAG: polymer-forming cytoskeletal protein [Planctomycetota bacterium]|nr:polymer-forming cytoskeletal protein [Planctomycetota bacterium]